MTAVAEALPTLRQLAADHAIVARELADALGIDHNYARRLLGDLERGGLAAGRNGEGGHILWEPTA